MSTSPPLSPEDTSRILDALQWKRCDSRSLQDFCQNRWGVPLGEPLVLDAWPQWQEGLTSEYASTDIINAAIELTIVPDRNHMALPPTEFYSMCEGTFAALNATNNRVAVRDEYIRLYDDIEETGRSAVVTGQPGSGRTFFLYYCLLNRLSLGKPVLLSPGPKEWFLFTKWGVWRTTRFKTTLNDDTKHEYRRIVTPDTWALVEGDTRSNKQNVEHQIWGNYLTVTSVLVSLPHAGRYDNWLLSANPPLLRILNPASFEEIVKGCRLLHDHSGRVHFRMAPYTREAFETLVRFMIVFGPAERNCLRSFTTSYTDAKIFASLERTTQDNPQSVSMEGLFSLESDESYQMAVDSIAIISPRISPNEDKNDNDTIGLDIASSWVFKQLLDVFILKNRKHVREFIDLCTRHSHTKALAGYFFETVIHTVLADADVDWRDRCALREFFPCGEPAHVAYNRFPLRRGHIFNRKRTLETYKGIPPEFDLMSYFQPIAKNNPTFDSILYAAEDDASPDEKAHVPLSPSSSHRRSSRHNTAETSLKKRSLRRSSPASSPRQSSFPMSFSAAFGQSTETRHQASPDQNSFVNSRSTSAIASGSSSAFRAGSPSGMSISGMSEAFSGGQSSPPMSMTGSDGMTARGYSPLATQSVRERPRPPLSILGRKRPASVAESRPAKRAREEVADVAEFKKHCVAMQMTVGKKHTWNEKGVNLLRHTFQEASNWHFVIVTHKKSKLDVKVLGDQLKADKLAPFFRWYHLTVDFSTTPWDDIDFDEADEDVETESSDVDTVEFSTEQ
ncbi:hypothetical protein PENSPDRAFT_753690 [Peniophora sp. CONT]|nr:hypothetical protein PENSPDRAFT_753690 [Peniophora sp. CONT]